jgi:spore germination protein
MEKKALWHQSAGNKGKERLLKKSTLLILGFILILGFFQGHCGLNGRERQKLSPGRDKPKILAFYEEGWGGIYTGSLGRLKEVKGKVDLVSPVWLGLKADGMINWDKTNPDTVDYLLQTGLEFVVLVTSGSGRNGSAILANNIHRRNALNSIAAYVARVKPDGICLDFEYLDPVLKKEFTQFCIEVKDVLAGKKLFIAAFPYVDWDEPAKEVYDYRRLGEIGDGVIVMTYDQHRPKDKPGPVASRDWVEANLEYFLARIEPEKLWLGIAGYGYQWQTGKGKATALPAWYCREKAITGSIADTYHPETGNDHLQYTANGKTSTIWWESARGMREKMALATEHSLAGVALWRLGYEEKEFWE